MKYYGLKVGNYFFLGKYSFYISNATIKIKIGENSSPLPGTFVDDFEKHFPDIGLSLSRSCTCKMNMKKIMNMEKFLLKIFAFKNNRCCVLYQLVIYQVSFPATISKILAQFANFFQYWFALVFNLHFIIFLFTLSVYL